MVRFPYVARIVFYSLFVDSMLVLFGIRLRTGRDF